MENDYSCSLRLHQQSVLQNSQNKSGAGILRRMRGHTSPSQLDDNGDTWSEIESLVDATAKLAQRSVSDREFCSDFVQSIVQATNAHGAAVWTCGVDDQYVIAAQIEPPDASGSDDSNLQIRRGNILEVARNQQATQLLARQSDSRLRNPMNSCVILQPVMYDEQSVAVVEVFTKSRLVLGSLQTLRT